MIAMKTNTMLDKVSFFVAAGEDDPTERHIAQLEAELLRKSTQLAELRAENAYLRKRYRARRPYNRLIVEAHRDALSLLILHQAGYPTTRRAVEDAINMPARRWRRAVGLLQIAALHDGYQFTLDDLSVEDLLSMLIQAAQDATAQPALLRSFTWR
jgi:hypothetical protein